MAQQVISLVAGDTAVGIAATFEEIDPDTGLPTGPLKLSSYQSVSLLIGYSPPKTIAGDVVDAANGKMIFLFTDPTDLQPGEFPASFQLFDADGKRTTLTGLTLDITPEV